MRSFHKILIPWILWQGVATAESPEKMLKHYEALAQASNQAFGGFSAARGKDLYMRSEPSEKGAISCTTCHTQDPKNFGKTRANKEIEPLAPAANRKRFTDLVHVEKWFARNCIDVFRRACTSEEKGDFITYLLTIK